MGMTTRFGGIKTVNDAEYDLTQIREGSMKNVHRDYIAHCIRWAWVARKVKQGDRILDVGCGQDVPLGKEMKFLGSFLRNYDVEDSLGKRPVYTGVDLNKIRWGTKSAGVTLLSEFNFVERTDELEGNYTLITSLEVIEHMQKIHGEAMLMAMHKVAAPNARLIISTPARDGDMASNHIHEYEYEELLETLTNTGWAVEESYGLYGAWPKIKKVCTDEERELYESLLLLYGHDLLSCLLAPKYPEASKAIMHVCRRV